MRTNIQYYTHSDIIILGTLNSKFPALLHAQLILYSTGDDQGWRKIGRFTVEVCPTLLCQKIINYTGLSVLPY